MTEIKGISVDEWKKKICEEAERLRPQLIELSHSIMMNRRSVFRSLNHLLKYVIFWKNRDLKQKEIIVTFQHPLRQ